MGKTCCIRNEDLLYLSNEGSRLEGLVDPLKCQHGQLSSFVIVERSLTKLEQSLPRCTAVPLPNLL